MPSIQESQFLILVQAIAQLEQEQQRYQALLERLRESGIDPEKL